MKKTILAVLVLVPVMEALALAQAPTADAKEGRFYVEGGIAFGVASMAPDFGSSDGFSAQPEFGFGLAAEYGITEQFAVFSKFGLGVILHDDPGVMSIGMTFDAAYKLIEKKGDTPALTGYAGLGFVNIDVDPDGGSSEDETDFVFEVGIQADISAGADVSIQPFGGFQLVAGDRPFDVYNGVLQVVLGVKALIKLSDNFFLVPSITFIGGNFQDSVLFGIAVQLQF
jgi:hypothetical protein